MVNARSLHFITAPGGRRLGVARSLLLIWIFFPVAGLARPGQALFVVESRVLHAVGASAVPAPLVVTAASNVQAASVSTAHVLALRARLHSFTADQVNLVAVVTAFLAVVLVADDVDRRETLVAELEVTGLGDERVQGELIVAFEKDVFFLAGFLRKLLDVWRCNFAGARCVTRLIFTLAGDVDVMGCHDSC